MLIPIIIIILIFFLINTYLRQEHFTNQLSETNDNINYQVGNGIATATGTITFPTPFSEIPMVFTQIIGSADTPNNVYSIQVYNISTTGFDYAKSKVYSQVLNNENVQNANVITLGTSSTELFMWFALTQSI